MQVFVPYPQPIKVVECLDRTRRWKQLTEVNQILDAIEGHRNGWKNHPATKMYTPYKEWLRCYRNCFSMWFSGREARAEYWSEQADLIRPPFLTDEFCDQHKRRLFTKNPEYYPQFSDYGTSEENWYVVDGNIIKYKDGKRI